MRATSAGPTRTSPSGRAQQLPERWHWKRKGYASAGGADLGAQRSCVYPAPRQEGRLSERIRVVSPVDGRIVAERALASDAEIAALLARARTAQAAWRQVPLRERQAIALRFVEACEANARAI